MDQKGAMGRVTQWVDRKGYILTLVMPMTQIVDPG